VSAKARARVSGRIVLALTANPFYSLDGVQPGTPLAAAARKLAVGHVFKVGGSEWYIASGAAANGILKVRHGIIQEIGIADGSITRGRKAMSTFLASFRSS
jgi:L-asparaginase II